MQDILKCWGLENAAITQIDTHQKHAWDIDGRYVLKYYKNPETIMANIKLVHLLQSEDIPVVAYIPTLDDSLVSDCGHYALAEKLAGEHVNLFENPHMAAVFGRALGQLHAALANIEAEFEFEPKDYLKTWHNYILPGLGEDVPAEIVQHTQNELESIYLSLPKQPIHRDVHAQNVLFDAENEKVVGWLDFDLAYHDARLFDIAYMFAGLIMDSYDDAEKVAAWERALADFLNGYDSINPLLTGEREALNTFMVSIELLFVTYWKSQNNSGEAEKALKLAKWFYERR
ncbi:MAG: phosphotransferase [Defluviitaleaceae bacterium]|nr:phosphotransferase [Defluviitaleaceae bacterium]